MNHSRDVKAVLFDVGNTLLQVHQSVGEIYSRTARQYGVEADPATIEAFFRTAFLERNGDLCNYTSEEAERLWWYKLVETVFTRAGLLEDFGSRFDDYFTELHALFSLASNWRVFEDTVPALEGVREMGYRRAVASNWDSRLPALLETMGLRSHFEFVLTSSEVGRAKPHPLLFERSLERLGLAPDEVVYVGDSYEHDVAGARGAGLTAILLDRRHDGPPGVDVIHSLSDLPSWLTTHTRAG